MPMFFVLLYLIALAIPQNCQNSLKCLKMQILGVKDIKGNYRPVSIQKYLKMHVEQMSQFFENIFSKYQCGFGRVSVPNNVFWQC